MSLKIVPPPLTISSLALATLLLGPACDSAVEITVHVEVPAAPGVCGDGALQPGEQCDDDIDNGPGARCLASCMLNVCGDGDVGPEEACDDGAGNGDEAACKLDCTFNVCGDGLVGPMEGCDDANEVDDDACSNECVAASCGDGVVQAPEVCDDGDDDDTDACTSACLAAACGDGVVQPDNGEGCDDGEDNAENGDCTLSCEPAACGDGRLHDAGSGAEACDYGPENGAGSACSGECKFNVCGDGYVGEGEACDDGNTLDGDGCVADCTLETCGNGEVDAGEQCDDGKDGDWGDECTDWCTSPTCGDGVASWAMGEACDVGPNNEELGACNPACQMAYCGDGYLWIGAEACDEGENNGPEGACASDCTLPNCGDGVLDPLEECDDANDDDFDGCTARCHLPVCGDGIAQAGEECDWGPYGGNWLECTKSCQFAACGDGVLWLDEEACDDGNTLDGDLCNADCTVPRRVFVTSATYTGDLGGIEGAAAKCQERADAAGLGGVWRAWVATPTTAVWQHIDDSQAGYARVDGADVAGSMYELFQGTLAAPIAVDEWGTPLGQFAVWTGMNANLTAATEHCASWTDGGSTPTAKGRVGRTTATDSRWTDEGAAKAASCASKRRLYCFEQLEE
ncbi:DUF4215 domain-containing protein [Nannocystis pusilla]|uniref:DUF4215 domain-containing protein n=1 Tax=Nannocystis pusilla TaxID=889268 RepID=UPI003BF45132